MPARILDWVRRPPNRGRRGRTDEARWGVLDGEQEGDGGIVSRRRGRHAAPAAGIASSVGGLRGRAGALLGSLIAAAEPRLAAAGAWAFERRVHVLVVAASVAAVAMIGGGMALISMSVAPPPDDEAATTVDAPRPTSSDPDPPSTFPPILPTPGPAPTSDPSDPSTPETGTGDPGADAPPDPTTEPTPVPGDPEDEPEGEPGDGEHPRDTAPGATNRPDKPGKG
ncbi:MAG TPA: hypothetical protein VFG92_04480 [Agromyces sp.]|nr:hypothetical protein [Agromyces sp.]